MAVAEDASTPVVARSATGWSTATLVSASFTPPASSLLMVFGQVGYTTSWTTTPTLSVSATGVTFTPIGFLADPVNQFLAQGTWYAYLPSSVGAITVTLTRAGTVTAAAGQLGVRVLTGTGSTPGGAVVGPTATQSPTPQVTITPTVVGSILYSFGDVDNNGTPTALASTTSIDAWNDTTDRIVSVLGKATSSSLSPVTLGFTNTDTATSDRTIDTAVEVVPLAPLGPLPRRVVTRAARIRSAHF